VVETYPKKRRKKDVVSKNKKNKNRVNKLDNDYYYSKGIWKLSSCSDTKRIKKKWRRRRRRKTTIIISKLYRLMKEH